MSSLSDAGPSRLSTRQSRRLAVVDGTLGDGSLVAVDNLLSTYARREQEQAAHLRAALLARDRVTHAAACRFGRTVDHGEIERETQ